MNVFFTRLLFPLLLLAALPSLAGEWTALSVPSATYGAGTRGRIRDMVHNNQAVVAVGIRGALMRSADGVQWEQVDPPYTNSSADIAVFDDVFILIHSDGIHRSSDGLRWTFHHFNVPGDVTSTGYDGRVLFIKAQLETAVTYYESQDGLNWTARPGHDGSWLEKVISEGPLILGLVGDQIASTTDYLNWTPIYQGRGFSDIVWTGERYVAVGGQREGSPNYPPTFLSNGWIATSSDGLSWREQEMPAALFSLAVGNGLVVAGGLDLGFASEDGLTWTSIGKIPAVDMLWDGHKFVSVGKQGAVSSSGDGFHWNNSQATTRLFNITDVAAGPPGWVAVGDNGALIYSADGQTWEGRSLENVSEVTAVAWTGTAFLAGGRETYYAEPVRHRYVIYRSEDGQHWSYHAGPIGDWSSVGVDTFVIGPRLTYALGGVYPIGSIDGENWGWAFGPSYHYAGASNGTNILFFDGTPNVYIGDDRGEYLGLAEFPADSYPDITNGIWTGSQYVLVGTDDTSAVSPDGFNWQAAKTGFNAELTDVAATASGLVAVAKDGLILTSLDGLVWTNDPSGSARDLNAVAYRDGRLIAVGAGGTLLKKDLELVPKAVLPWVVANNSWRSEVSLFNTSRVPAEARLWAIDAEGKHAETTVLLAPMVPYAAQAADLFPDLNGYSLYVYADVEVYATTLLYATVTDSGRSPAQSAGPRVADLSSSLLFGYLPGADAPAFVLSAPAADGEVIVDLELIATDGTSRNEVVTLLGGQPHASLVAWVFEDLDREGIYALRATARNGALLAGLSFVFNELGEPSMTTAHSLAPQSP